MTYWGLNTIFLAIVAATGISALVVTLRRARDGQSRTRATRTRTLSSCFIVTAVLLVMTAVFDNVMIGIGLVGYDASKISGVFFGIAPLEDFSYAVAALILLPSLWVLTGARRRGNE